MVDYVPPLMPFVIERIEQEKPIPPSVMYTARQSGYDLVKYKGEWNEYQVFLPYFSDNSFIHCTGSPRYILKNDNELRWTNDKEGFILLQEKF